MAQTLVPSQYPPSKSQRRAPHFLLRVSVGDQGYFLQLRSRSFWDQFSCRGVLGLVISSRRCGMCCGPGKSLGFIRGCTQWIEDFGPRLVRKSSLWLPGDSSRVGGLLFDALRFVRSPCLRWACVPPVPSRCEGVDRPCGGQRCVGSQMSSLEECGSTRAQFIGCKP